MQVKLIHTKNFSAKGIHFFMKLHCKLRKLNVPSVIYNHALFYDEKLGEVYEASYPHVVKISIDEWNNIEKNKTAIIKTLDLNFTCSETNSIKKYLEKQVGKPYEIINFWWHILKVFTGKWYGAKHDKRHYCYELILHALNTLHKYNEDAYLNPYEFGKKFKVYDSD